MTHGGGELHRFPAGVPRARPGLSRRRHPGAAADPARRARGYGVLLHRSVIGRALYAIGFSPAGARYAGIPVGAARRARLSAVRAWSSSLAAIIYVAHLGQARSDAGTGYELDAITAVVLGGTSVFGGRGTLWGTVLGLFAIAVLRNGLQLAALPIRAGRRADRRAAACDDRRRPAARAARGPSPAALRRKK